jgi:flagellar basal body-associated protein FliL
VPLSPILPIAAAVASAYLMNGLPLDTWLRLIVWMSIGLVIYFAYSYKNSNLAFFGDSSAAEQLLDNAEPGASKAPIAPILGIVLTIVLTIWMFAFTDHPPVTRLIETAIRLFVWLTVGVMIYFLTYGRKGLAAQARNPQTATIGLTASLVNLFVWLGVTYWFFAHFAELHRK